MEITAPPQNRVRRLDPSLWSDRFRMTMQVFLIVILRSDERKRHVT